MILEITKSITKPGNGKVRFDGDSRKDHSGRTKVYSRNKIGSNEIDGRLEKIRL